MLPPSGAAAGAVYMKGAFEAVYIKGAMSTSCHREQSFQLAHKATNK